MILDFISVSVEVFSVQILSLFLAPVCKPSSSAALITR
jgi:hypothetical protein